MRLGRKDKRQGGARGAVTSTSRRPASYDLGQNSVTDGLPGRAGYAGGPRTPLPTFFHMRRPDGRPDPVYKKKLWFG